MPDSGRMTWAQALDGPLAGATCLWQDLDGLHVGPAPAAAPPTSILWAWREDPVLVRLRLDGQTAYVAMHVPGGSGGVPGTPIAEPPVEPTVPWAVGPGGDGRVAGIRMAPDGVAPWGAGARYEQVIVEGPGDGTGPVTFVRPRRGAAGSG